MTMGRRVIRYDRNGLAVCRVNYQVAAIFGSPNESPKPPTIPDVPHGVAIDYKRLSVSNGVAPNDAVTAPKLDRGREIDLIFGEPRIRATL